MEILDRKWVDPIWDRTNSKFEPYEYSKILAMLRLEVIDDKGRPKTYKQNIIIPPLDKNNNVPTDWKELMDEFGIEKISENTRKRVEARRAYERTQAIAREQEEANNRLMDLFNKKISLYEIPEIKESKNSKLKSQIRKAKTDQQLIINAAKVIYEQQKLEK